MKEKLEISVIVEDGCCMAVLGNQAALDADIDVTVCLFDSDRDNKGILNDRYYENNNMHDIPYAIDHCSDKDEE